jgi:hypothetical protein
LKRTLEVINDLVKDNIIDDYAIGGSIAAVFYAKISNTDDLDIFIIPKMSNSIITYLGPLYEHLKGLGYEMDGQHVIIEGTPVDFLPIYNPLTDEALQNAPSKTYEGVQVKVFSPEYIVAISLQTGRSKDFARIDALMELLDQDKLTEILKRHGLYQKWVSHVSK